MSDGKGTTTPQRRLTYTGAVILGVAGAVGVGFYAAVTPFLSPALRKICLPYVPATTAQVQNVLSALRGRAGGSLLDLGSGDGRIVLEAAQHGFEASGVELNVWLVMYSRLRAWKLGLQYEAKFLRQDLWKVDLSTYDNIVVFGVEQMMLPLERKFIRELAEKSCIVACRFPIPNWQPVKTVGHGIDTVWLYHSSKM